MTAHISPNTASSASPPAQQTTTNRAGKGKVTLKEAPVKAACLSCRSKKAKCDGIQPKCGTCEKRNLVCEYVKSRRGGPRRRKQPPPSALQQFLQRLDTFFTTAPSGLSPSDKSDNEDTTNVVKDVSSREAIFESYYTDIHPFLPVMPHKSFMSQVAPTLPARSPFLLACSTVLVLAPHPSDPYPASPSSKRLRSAVSHALAAECESLIEELTKEGKADVECVQALAILCIWAWAQSLNLEKHLKFSTQSVNLALQLGLHEIDKANWRGNGTASRKQVAIEGEDWKKDLGRRTFWVIYFNQISAASISGTPCAFAYDDNRIKTNFPVCSLDDQSWPKWINAARRCARVLEIIGQSYMNPNFSSGDLGQMQTQMITADTEILEQLRAAEEETVIALVPGCEEEVVRNQQLAVKMNLASMHIHIHRHQAFPEVSLFSRMMCGLPGNASTPSHVDEEIVMPQSSMPSSTSLSPMISSEPLGDFNMSANHYASEGLGLSQILPSAQLSAAGTVTASALVSGTDLYGTNDSQTNTASWNFGIDPWFSNQGGAGSLYAPPNQEPTFYQPVTSSFEQPQSRLTAYEASPDSSRQGSVHPSTNSPQLSSSRSVTNSDGAVERKLHKPWAIGDDDKPLYPDMVDPEKNILSVFPPGVSLARCATAAHTIVRMEVIHRSAVIALWKGPPKWMPFCSCGLVAAAYSFLLLALAIHAENSYGATNDQAIEQIEGLLTNVKILLAGLEAYGVMWDGIDAMGREVRAALEAATKLPDEIRGQLAIQDTASSTASTGQIEYPSLQPDQSLMQQQYGDPTEDNIMQYQQQNVFGQSGQSSSVYDIIASNGSVTYGGVMTNSAGMPYEVNEEAFSQYLNMETNNRQ